MLLYCYCNDTRCAHGMSVRQNSRLFLGVVRLVLNSHNADYVINGLIIHAQSAFNTEQHISYICYTLFKRRRFGDCK